MKKKTTTTNLKRKIRRRYECGENLIELAIEYKINYGTLRNMASREGWEKGKVLDLVRIKETLEIADEAVEKRADVIQEYKLLTDDLRKYAIDKATGRNILSGDNYTSPVNKAKEEAFLKRVSAIDTLYRMDKELYSIHSDKEQLELKQESIKYEEMRKRLEEESETKHLT